MPATQYRRTTEDSIASQNRSLVSGALFETQYLPSPYGLGVDGAVEEQSYVVNKDPAPFAMSILLSGAKLPPGPTIEEQANEVDSVLSLTHSMDSVLGRED